MARVYISVLGTTDYKPCTYVLPDGQKEIGVRFVQEATVRYSCKGWTPEDRIRILTTDGAHEKNWGDGGHTSDPADISFRGLEGKLKSMSRADVQSVPIPKGESHDEIWTIFQVLFDILNPGDTVVFDVTYGFRSLPMLVMVVLQYARTTKNINLQGIYYGAFEAKKNNEAPVFDLTPFDNLVSWSNAIHRFLSSGHASDASALAKERVLPVLKESKGQDEAAKAIRRVADLLQGFSEAMWTCRGRSVGPTVTKLKEALSACDNTQFVPAFRPLLDLVAKSLASFKGDEIQDGIAAARWCDQHNLVQQGYTILQETLISYVAQALRVPAVEPDDYRKGIHGMLGTDYGILIRFKKDPTKYPQREGGPLLHFPEHQQIVEMFGALGDDRNDINHAGMRKDPKPPVTFLENLPLRIQEVEKVVENPAES